MLARRCQGGVGGDAPDDRELGAAWCGNWLCERMVGRVGDGAQRTVGAGRRTVELAVFGLQRGALFAVLLLQLAVLLLQVLQRGDAPPHRLGQALHKSRGGADDLRQLALHKRGGKSEGWGWC